MIRTTIEIDKEAMHFAAAHFTLFSVTERENLHGHNFHVALEIDADVSADGLAFDYNIVKRQAQQLCDALDERLLLPDSSPYMKITEDGNYTVAHFNGERLPFLARDVLILPVSNITVEALAAWFLEQLRASPVLADLGIDRLEVKISSSPGQWARAVG